jgi:pantetheine-phosphate adenylyltransferase
MEGFKYGVLRGWFTTPFFLGIIILYMKTTIIYPGTFDPITRGHEDLVKRALCLFDKVIVAIAKDTRKSTMFPFKKRVELARKTLDALSNVEVCGFSGLSVAFAKQKKAKAILRGMRAVSDFEYEFQLAAINKHLDSDIETIFLPPSTKYTFVSSSIIREAAEVGGDISEFVHPIVEKAFKAKT